MIDARRGYVLTRRGW